MRDTTSWLKGIELLREQETAFLALLTYFKPVLLIISNI